ncbi:MAG: PBP1A family penicillin-binding protein [Alphaproteobacteria bacterium]|nr:PBP1A family penicillin-binding protein [Alphaproteobacteria bacterium]
MANELRAERRPSSAQQQKDKPRRPRKRRRFLRALVKWSVVTMIWTGVVVGVVLTYYAFTLPDLDRIHIFDRRPSITIVGADGQAIATSGDYFAGPVRLNEISRDLVNAVIATEDRRFYWHFGVDPIGLARAAAVNVVAQRVVQGGSTITQQLAKNVFLTPDRSFGRKIQEFLLALWLERRFTKDQILTLYLNRVYLGAGTFGVEAAARRYFGRSARALTLHESAIIAGLLRSPSRLAPTVNPEGAETRAASVLENMVDAGYITRNQAMAAMLEPLRLAAASAGLGPGAGNATRYFTDWLVGEVQGFVGIDRDLVVHTTLDARLQRAAEAALAESLARDGRNAGVEQGALVALSPDGAVRAMVGGRDYRQSQFNRAADARRQPGSAFKPFVFLAAIEEGLSADDRVSDLPVTIGRWSPRNFDSGHRGDITLREALARSVNTATVRLAQRVGIGDVIATARRCGISSPLRRNFATALGASEVTLLELTGAFAPFANGGEGIVPYGVVEIREPSGRVVWRREPGGSGRVIARPALAAMIDMMSAVVRSGTGRAAALDRPAAGKTGTSQEFRDAWFVGFTADLVAGVWMGNDDGTPMERITGGSLPARAWRSFMVEAHRGLEPRPLLGTAVAAVPR